MRVRLAMTFGALAVFAASVQPAHSDPCGMVPPVTMIERDPIVRVGAQKTFVSFHKGVETIVLRPGFKGKVDEFGMSIPFPTAPAIRKIDDNIFPHIAAAIDPPAVLAYVRRRWRRRMSKSAGSGRGARPSASAADEGALGYDEVRVVRQEAVGMYDVAVLEAGSAKALQKWMDSQGFKYGEPKTKPRQPAQARAAQRSGQTAVRVGSVGHQEEALVPPVRGRGERAARHR